MTPAPLPPCPVPEWDRPCTLCDYRIPLCDSGLHSVTPNVFILCARFLKRPQEPAPPPATPPEARLAALSHIGTGAMRRAMPDSDKGHE